MSLKQWGRMRITGGGDLIQARGYHKLRSDERDSSFIRYELLVDRMAHRPNAPEELQQKSHYGQLERLFTLDLPPKSTLNTGNRTRTLLLALVLEASAVQEVTYEYKVVWYEGNLTTGEVVDAETIQCVVGRIPDKKRWWIIDRSSSLAHPLFE
ncbi:hypothetical protein BDV93DRAFT_454445 [Ceratobasidium sp. AG-I]|nr:hypothetical protein BDV93DRAFT_454445 [Ceratobasidium sp. AG-I]